MDGKMTLIQAAVAFGDMEDLQPIKENHTLNFESPSHTGMLLSGLNSLRNKNLLVDITLHVDGQSFEAHRVVLAACSDYFRAMFTSELAESREKEVTLSGVSALGMQFLLEYAYTSRLVLNLANIHDVLSAASHVQLVTVIEACSDYLQGQLDLENCVDIVTLAETYSLFQLRKRVYGFISGHLLEFSQTPEFERLSGAQLEYLLDSENPVDCSESDVLHIVLQWTTANPTNPSLCRHLLTKVHYEEIPPSILKVVWDHSLSLLPFVSSLKTRIVAHMHSDRSTNPLHRDTRISSLVNSRGMELAIIKVGGFGISGITNEITYLLPSVGRWKKLTKIPHVEQCNFGTAVLNNHLYILGGCFNQCLQENIHPFGFSFNPRFGKWETLAPMLTERCRFTLNVVHDKLYAIGGCSETFDDDQDQLGPCERFDPETDTWHSISPLPISRSQHAGAAWKTLLFISGGLEPELVSNSLKCYNTTTNEWTNKAVMLSPRADHSMVTYKDKLYVCGGWMEDEAVGNRQLVSTIDEYCINTDQWQVKSAIPTPRYHAGITVVNHQLFVIGGFHADATFDRTTGVIECLDLETFEWSTMERYPQDIWEHVCTTLYIPKSREDMDVREDVE